MVVKKVQPARNNKRGEEKELTRVTFVEERSEIIVGWPRLEPCGLKN